MKVGHGAAGHGAASEPSRQFEHRAAEADRFAHDDRGRLIEAWWPLAVDRPPSPGPALCKMPFTVLGGRENLPPPRWLTEDMDRLVPSPAAHIYAETTALARMPLAAFIAQWRILTGEPPAVMLNSRSEMISLLVASIAAAPLNVGGPVFRRPPTADGSVAP